MKTTLPKANASKEVSASIKISAENYTAATVAAKQHGLSVGRFTDAVLEYHFANRDDFSLNRGAKDKNTLTVPARPSTRATLKQAAKEIDQPVKLVASLALEHAAEMLKDGRLKFTPNTGEATVPVMLPAKLASHIASVVNPLGISLEQWCACMLSGDDPESMRYLAGELFEGGKRK